MGTAAGAGDGTTAPDSPAADIGVCGRRRHWQSIYQDKDADRVSWFEAEPTHSLDMLNAVGASSDDALIDVGAGASRLAGALLRRGYTDVTALDICDDGLAVARDELGDGADRITWIVADLLTWRPQRRYDVWHDRAVFHFLTSPEQQQRYLAVADAALAPGARMVVATFAEDGPEQCSGLPVCRYGADELFATFETLSPRALELVEHRRYEHTTPWDAVQPFTWIALRVGT